MEPSTTIRKMISGNKIAVPSYQRAYSWETPRPEYNGKTHTDVFLADLKEYIKSGTTSTYYFGHFLFQEKVGTFNVIDGQQRLTTIVIFLSALFAKLKTCRGLTEKEAELFEDIIKRNSTVRFSTVDYDNQLFQDYVINQTKKDQNGLDTESAKRIVCAYQFFAKSLEKEREEFLSNFLMAISEASCTTHNVTDESEAIQMFIFQNNRGKIPSSLEIIKAQFMYNIHLRGSIDTDALLIEIKSRFEKIYKSISSIEGQIDEDDILVYTLRVYYNSLWEWNSQERVNKELALDNSIKFVRDFSESLQRSFEHLQDFYTKAERRSHPIHSLVVLGAISVACPFIIKAYSFGLSTEKLEELAEALESLVLRDRLIGTRAALTSRINHAFSQFSKENSSVKPIIDRVAMMKTTEDWGLAYWNNLELEKAIQGHLDPSIAKFLLWKYENFLLSKEKPGYAPTRYEDVVAPELEHIAPQTEPSGGDHGYGAYDQEFCDQFLHSLGNYVLLPKSHNCSISNASFDIKRKTYNVLCQQREICELVPEGKQWNKDAIQKRKNRIVRFVIEHF